MLTPIALRMLYSLVGPKKARAMGGPGDADVEQDVGTQDVEPFAEFVKPFLASSFPTCGTENFHAIVLAMREVLEWEGPLFLAVDEFAAPFYGASEKQNTIMLRHSLARLYYHVLDASPPLKNAADGTFRWFGRSEHVSLFERYCIVSVHDGLDIKNDTEFSYKRRGLIAQSMPAIGVLALLHGYASGDGRFVVPSGDVVVNLEEVSGFTRLEACKLVAGLRHHCIFDDCRDGWNVPSWNNVMNDATRRPCQFTSSKPPRVLASAQFLRSVADGWAPCNDSCDWWTRHYMVTLSTWLQAQADSDAGFVSIGALVVAAPLSQDETPRERMSIEVALPDYDATRYKHHCYDTRVDAVNHKDKLPDCSVCRKMTALWLRSASEYLGELTFRALALRLACVLRTDIDRAVITAEQGAARWEAELLFQQQLPYTSQRDWVLSDVLKGAVCAPWFPHVRSLCDLEGKQLRGAALCEIDVRNFPLMFNDVHAGADAKLRAQTSRATEENVRHAVEAEHGVALKGLMILAERFMGQRVPDGRCSELSAEAVRRALALGDHFCFRPRNPGNHGADSVFFLRVASSRPEWVVLMLQRKQSPKERSDGATGADSTRRSTDLLLSVLEDTSGAQHSLKYVRVLMAASAVDACLPAGGR